LNPDLSPTELIQRRFDHLVLRPNKKGVWFRCPICANRVKHDGEGLEPCCTGPHPSLDEHPLEAMVLER
jgi:hypothetical protein